MTKPALSIQKVTAIGVGYLALVFLFGLLATIAPKAGIAYGSPGSGDFIQYWTSFRLLNGGGNPYDGVAMHQAQLMVGQSPDKTVLMWNPPWLVSMLAPVLTLPFPQAALCWLTLNIAMLMAIARLGPRALGRPALPLIPAALGTILFYPVLDCIRFGQLSIFLTFAFTLFLFSVRFRHWGAAAIALLPLTAKPHLFLIFIPPGLIWFLSLPSTARRRFLGFALAGTAVLLGGTVLLWPDSVAQWLTALSQPPSGVGTIPREIWKTATLTHLVRSLVESYSGERPTWPMWAVPMIAFVLTCLYFRHHRTTDWSAVAPPLLCVALTTSGYGWAYDQSLLVLCQLGLLTQALLFRGQRRTVLLIGLIAIQSVAFYLGTRADNAQHYYVWIPWAYLALLWFGWNGGEKHASTEGSATALA